MSSLSTAAIAALLLATATSAQLALPAHTSSYEAPRHARGFCFQAPVDFSVTGLQVPDEGDVGVQNVALYRLGQRPPRYYETLSAQPVWFRGGAPSSEILAPSAPIPFRRGEWFAVLGTCGDETRQVSSYGANASPSTVLGQPVTLERLLLQDNLTSSAGVGGLSTNLQNPLGRVRVYVSGGARADVYGLGSGPLPLSTLLPDDTSPPRLGGTARMHVRVLQPREPFGILLMGAGRAELPTPFGTVLVAQPLLLFEVLPSVIPSAGMELALPLPALSGLSGVRVHLQVLAWRDPQFALTNGLEWRLGL